MGMFDTIRCDMPLPDGQTTTHDFQTKFFDYPYGNEFRITPDGKLVTVKSQVAHLEEGLLEYHGLLRFYDLDAEKVWHEYEAKFTDGLCTEITCLYSGHLNNG